MYINFRAVFEQNHVFRVAAWGTQGHVAAHFSTATPAGIEPTLAKNAGSAVFYPTVVSHNYTVSYNLPQSGTTYVNVFDGYSKLVFEQKIND